jgi:Ca-activated chloride channel homolog
MKIETYLDYRVILAQQARLFRFALWFQAGGGISPRPVPAAFCVVLDRSGSMQGEPLRQARKAAQLAIRNLRPHDQLSLVVFDTEAQTLIPLQPAQNTADWLRTVETIEAGSSTNLIGGWMLGRDELKKATKEASRRLLLLSDGHLNAGIVEPPIVRHVVGAGRENDFVRTSCLGFGDGYNEDLMAELARVSGGQFYDAASAEKLPAIFASELDGLQKLSVQNLRVRFRRLDFCEQAEPLWNGAVVPLPDGRSEISVGDLVSGEVRVLCFALNVLPLPLIAGKPAFTLEGELLLELEFLFDELGEGEVTSRIVTQLIRIQATQNPDEVKIQEEVVSWVAMQKAARVLQDVNSRMDGGRGAEAVTLLRSAIERLKEYGPAAQVAEALKMLENLLQTIQQNEWSDRERKNSRYLSESCLKMSSAEMWSGVAEEPSFKRRPREQPHKPPTTPGVPPQQQDETTDPRSY